MDYVKLFNDVAVKANPNLLHKQLVEDINQPIKDTDIDSLDVVITSVFLCELYGIEESIGKNMPLDKVSSVFEFIELNKTKEPQSIEQALEQLP